MIYVYTGSGMTETGPISDISFLPIDAPSGSAPIPRGSQSYERWVRVKGTKLSRLWVTVKNPPDGVTVKVGVTDSYQTPTNSVSAIATKLITPEERTMVQTDEFSTSRFVVLQAFVAASAPPGPVTGMTLEIGWHGT
jgi:hypothetical protein